jgi:hypothetical protein
MADIIRHGRLVEAISSYFPPGYPLLVALFLQLGMASPATEFAVMKIANLTIFVSLLIALELFLAETYRLYQSNASTGSDTDTGTGAGTENQLAISPALFKANCYAVFAWIFLPSCGVSFDNADALLSSLILFCISLVLRIRRLADKAGASQFAILGILSSYACITKTFAYCLVPLLLLFAIENKERLREKAKKFAWFLLGFAAFAMPYIFIVWNKGLALSLMMVSKLNYRWQILEGSGPALVEPGDPDFSSLIHPMQVLVLKPVVLGFATPVPGTFPPWYDAAYWLQGIAVNFSLRASATALALNFCFYCQHYLAFFFLSWFVVSFITTSTALSAKRIFAYRVPASLAAYGLTLYALVSNPVVESRRYICVYLFLLFCTMLVSIRLTNNLRSRVALYVMTLVTMLYCGFFLKSEIQNRIEELKGADKKSFDTGTYLRSIGLNNLPIALIGNANSDFDWARISRLRIIASITDAGSYWEAPPAVRREINKAVKRYGAKFLIQYFSHRHAGNVDVRKVLRFGFQAAEAGKSARFENGFVEEEDILNPKDGWKQVPGTDCYYLAL